MRKLLLVAAAGFAALVAAGAVLVLLVFEDPAPNRFLVGASRQGAGDSVVIHVGDCMGGRLLSLRVAVDHGDGFGVDDGDTVLWSAVAGGEGGTMLAPGGVLQVEVGSVPAGMVETVPFEGSLPGGETIQVSIDTSRQGYGFFFEVGDLEPGEIFAGGYGHLGSDRFVSITADLC